MNDENLDGVRQCVANVLLITDLDRILVTSSLVAELGADSLDFLDLVFQLEEHFDIKIARSEVNLFERLLLPENEAHVNGVLTPPALERLRALMPEVNPEAFQPGLAVGDVPKLLTVETFLNIVNRKVEEKKRAAALG